MKINEFPFPDKELAREELLRDFSINKIPPEDIDLIIEIAWNQGVKASEFIKNNYVGHYDFKSIMDNFDLKIIDKNIDHIIGDTRFFSEYYTKKGKILMYTKSIENWSEFNGLSFEVGYNLILCHEFFHYLEYTKFGLTSNLYQRPLIKLGRMSIGKTGVRAMSEIGAHSFVYNLFRKEEGL